MSLRAALVDDLKTVTAITDIVGDRITDMFYEFEDFLNSSANSVSKFPAISIEADGYEPEDNITGHDNLINGLYTIKCYQVVNLSKMRNRSQAVRDKERDKLRDVDAVSQAVIDYLVDKRGMVGEYYLRHPHIEAVSDGVEESAENREVITREISFSVTYSREAIVIDVPVNTAIPVVTGTPEVGEVLTTDNGTWTNSPTSYTYRWLRDDVEIVGETSNTYTLVLADEGTTIKSEVTAINAGGSSSPAESAGTDIPSSTIQRNFTTLDPALSQYYTLGSTVTLTGDYKISGKVVPDGSDILYLFGNNTSFTSRLRITSAGQIEWRESSDSSGNRTSNTNAPIGKESIIEVERIGANGTIKLNGVETFNGATAVGDCVINTLQATQSSTGSGIISDVKITDAGTLIHQWNLDEDFGSTSTAIDSVGSNNATAQNIVSSDSENFTFNGAVSPNTWTNDDETRVIEVAGT
jgi:hypothetical protein